MTISEFLEENVYNLTPEEYNQALGDLDSLDAKSWIQKYTPLMQEKTASWNKVDEVKQSKPLAKRIADAFADSKFNPGKSFKDDVYEDDFSDVPRAKFEEALSKMRDYYEQELEQRKLDADKEKRKREVKNWGWRDLLASDYEKARYVDNPSAALFGEQATSLSKDLLGKGEAISDLAFGAAGAVGDVIPGWGSVLAGPGARAFRDVRHKVTDSPYQKDWGDIVKGAGADVMISGGTVALPNFRKQMRIYNNSMKLPESVVATQAIEAEANNIKEGLKLLNQAKGSLELRQAFEAMPESQLKKDLAPLMKTAEIDKGKVQEIIKDNLYALQGAKDAATREELRGGYSYVMDKMGLADKALLKTANAGKEAKPLHSLTQKVLATTEPTAAEMKSATRKMLLDKYIGTLSNPAANLMVTVPGGRAKGQVQRVETPEEREQIEAIKQREDRFWRAGFKPNKNESILYKAYKEWAEENGEE